MSAIDLPCSLEDHTEAVSCLSRTSLYTRIVGWDAEPERDVLQAAMARKLRDSDIATQWTLNYQLNSKLRMQFNIASSSPYPRTLVFQYSSETTPPPLPR